MSDAADVGARVSVIVPTYDRRVPLERALGSVLGQTVRPHEVIVVDDGSTDGTAELVAALARRDPVVVSLTQQRRGAAAARNAGIDVATGDLLAFQDSDDEWAPTFLERMLPVVAGRAGVVAFCSHRIRYRDGRSAVVPPSPVARPDRVIPRTNVVSTQTILADARIFDRVRFDPAMRRFQDWDLWLTMLERRIATFEHVPEVLAELSRMDDSISEGSPGVRDASLRRIARKHLRFLLSRPRALGRIALRGYVRPVVETTRGTARQLLSTAAGERPARGKVDA